MKDEGSDMVEWYVWDPAYGNEKTTLTETDRPEDDDIGSFDKYIGVTVKLDNVTNSCGNIATLKCHATNANGFEIGHAHNNPLLDTREYEVELEDSTTDRYFANAITENVYSQPDIEGHQTLVTSEIIYHGKDDSAVKYIYEFTGKRFNIPKKTKKIWGY